MKKNRAFTLTELIVGVVIGSIFMLAVGTISGIGQSSFENIKRESQVYGDMFNGLELMKNTIHKASSVSVNNWSNPPWIRPVLVADNSAFGLYKPADSPTVDLVYLKDKNNTSARDIILYKANSLDWTFSENGKLITVEIQGQKDTEDFDLSTSILKRN